MFQFKINKVVYSIHRDSSKIVPESIDGSQITGTAPWNKKAADAKCSDSPFTKVQLDNGKGGKSFIVVAESEDSLWDRLVACRKQAEQQQ
jgi:hypothetical protein